jgi:hypothetical protein
MSSAGRVAAGNEGATGSFAASRVLGLYCLQSLAACASDMSTLLRKAAISVLHDLLLADPASSYLQTSWLQCVLPLTIDSDVGVAAKAVECVTASIIDRVILWKTNASALLKAGASLTGLPLSAPAAPATSVAHISKLQAGLAASAGCWPLLGAISSHADLARCMGAAVASQYKIVGSDNNNVGTDVKAAAAAAVVAAKIADFDSFINALRFTADPQRSADGVRPALAEQLRSGSWLLIEHSVACLCAGADSASNADAGVVTSVEGARNSKLKRRLQALAATLQSVLEVSWSAALRDLHSSALHASGAAESLDSSAIASANIDESLADTNDVSRTATHMLRTVACLAPYFTDSAASFSAKLRADLQDRLCAFAWDTTLASEAVAALAAMPHNNGKSEQFFWAEPLLAASEGAISSFLRCAGPNEAAILTHTVSGALFCIGAVAMATMSGREGSVEKASSFAFPGHIVSLVEALLAPKMLSLPPPPAFTATTSASIAPPSVSFSIPTDIRAHAFLALGKLCLCDAGLAKRYIAVFVRDLHPRSGTPAVVRNNIL